MTKTLKKALLAILAALCAVTLALSLAFVAGCSDEKEPDNPNEGETPGGTTPGGTTPGGTTPGEVATTYNVDVYLQSELATYIAEETSAVYEKSATLSKQDQQGTVGQTVTVDASDFAAEGYAFNADKSTTSLTLAASGNTISLYFDAVIAEYPDAFGGSDTLCTAVGNLYIKRLGLSVKTATAFDASTGYFTFETDDEDFSLQGKLDEDSFYYFKDLYNKEFTAEDESTLKIEAPNKVTWTDASGSDPVVGSYEYDFDLDCFKFITPTAVKNFRVDVSEETFTFSDGAEGTYTYSQLVGSVTHTTVITLDGFGNIFAAADGESMADGMTYTFDSVKSMVTAYAYSQPAFSFRINGDKSITPADQYYGLTVYNGSDDSHEGKSLTFDGFGNVTVKENAAADPTEATYVIVNPTDIDFEVKDGSDFNPQSYVVVTDSADEKSYYAISSSYFGYSYNVPTGTLPYGRIDINGALTLNGKACGTADTAPAFVYYDGSYAWLFVGEDDGTFSVAGNYKFYINYRDSSSSDHKNEYKLDEYSYSATVYFTYADGKLVPVDTISVGEAPVTPEPPAVPEANFDIKDLVLFENQEEGKLEVKTVEGAHKAYFTPAGGSAAEQEVEFYASSATLSSKYFGFYKVVIDGEDRYFQVYESETDTFAAKEVQLFVSADGRFLDLVGFGLDGSDEEPYFYYGVIVEDDYVFVAYGPEETGWFATDTYDRTEGGVYTVDISSHYESYEESLWGYAYGVLRDEDGLFAKSLYIDIKTDVASGKFYTEIPDSITDDGYGNITPLLSDDGSSFEADGFGFATLTTQGTHKGTYKVILTIPEKHALIYECDFEGVTQYVLVYPTKQEDEWKFEVVDTLDLSKVGYYCKEDYVSDEDYYIYTLGNGKYVYQSYYFNTFVAESTGEKIQVDTNSYYISEKPFDAEIFIFSRIDMPEEKYTFALSDSLTIAEYDGILGGAYKKGSSIYSVTPVKDGEEVVGSFKDNGLGTYTLTINGEVLSTDDYNDIDTEYNELTFDDEEDVTLVYFDEATGREFYLDIVLSSDGETVDYYNYRSLPFGSFFNFADYLKLNASDFDNVNGLVLDGHGKASLYGTTAEGDPGDLIKTGTYAAAKNGLYTLSLSEEQPITIRLGEEDDYYYYVFDEDMYALEVSDDWSLTLLDGYGRYIVTDKYGNSAINSYVPVEEGLILLIDNETFETSYATVVSGKINVLTDDYVVYNGTLYLYQGTSAEVVIPAGVTKISGEAFDMLDDEFITSLDLGSVQEIESGAFYGKLSEDVTTVTIPATVTFIGAAAFTHNYVEMIDFSEAALDTLALEAGFADESTALLVKDVDQLTSVAQNADLADILPQFYINFDLTDAADIIETDYTNLSTYHYTFEYFAVYKYAMGSYEGEVYAKYYVDAEGDVYLYNVVAGEAIEPEKFTDTNGIAEFGTDFGFKADSETTYTLTDGESEPVTATFKVSGETRLSDFTFAGNSVSGVYFDDGSFKFEVTAQDTQVKVSLTVVAKDTFTYASYSEATLQDNDGNSYTFEVYDGGNPAKFVGFQKSGGIIVDDLVITEVIPGHQWVLSYYDSNDTYKTLSFGVTLDASEPFENSTLTVTPYQTTEATFFYDDYTIIYSLDENGHFDELVSVSLEGNSFEVTSVTITKSSDFSDDNDFIEFKLDGEDWVIEFDGSESDNSPCRLAKAHYQATYVGGAQVEDLGYVNLTITFNVDGKTKVATFVSATCDGVTTTEDVAEEVFGSSTARQYVVFTFESGTGAGYAFYYSRGAESSPTGTVYVNISSEAME